MEDIQLLDDVERYLRDEMTPAEKMKFEELRKTNPEVDQMVVEQTIFLNQVERFGERKKFKSLLADVHRNLDTSGAIKAENPKRSVIHLITRYRRVIAVAASIAGITAIAINSLVNYVAPKANTHYVEQLSRKVHKLEQKQNALSNQIVDNEKAPKIPVDVKLQSGGTGFLVDPRGFIVTNAHVIKDYNNVVVQNTRGQVFKADIISIVDSTDLAILKINDTDFKPLTSLPYGFRNSGAELGEQIFTLGYPRDEIVYGEGYLSARTGFNGDTLACQIAVAANPGNSGGPVMNKNGEVVGILSTRQVLAQGVVFAIKTKNIYRALEAVKQDSSYQHIKLNTVSSVKGLDRVQQIKKIQDCVFMVKTY